MIPNLFSKLPAPRKLPAGMAGAVAQLKAARSRQACLEKAYDIITRRFHGRKLFTYLRLPLLFRSDVAAIWERPGHLHCTHFNFLLRILLVASGKFTEADFRQRLTLVYGISPHQYLSIRLGGKWVDVDPWAKEGMGLPLGRHAGF